MTDDVRSTSTRDPDRDGYVKPPSEPGSDALLLRGLICLLVERLTG